MKFLVLVLLFVPMTLSADDRIALQDDAQLEAGLRIVAQADLVRKNCDRVSLRIWRGLGLMNSLTARGYDLGYTRTEMRAYIENDDEKARVRALAKSDLERFGADFESPETLCDVAKERIAAEKGFGRYLNFR